VSCADCFGGDEAYCQYLFQNLWKRSLQNKKSDNSVRKTYLEHTIQ